MAPLGTRVSGGSGSGRRAGIQDQDPGRDRDTSRNMLQSLNFPATRQDTDSSDFGGVCHCLPALVGVGRLRRGLGSRDPRAGLGGRREEGWRWICYYAL